MQLDEPSEQNWKAHAALTRIIYSPYLTKSRVVPTLVISTVPLNVVSSKTLLAFLGNRCTKHGSSVSKEVRSRTDSRHFDSPVERRFFEDIANVSGNRCFKHGSSSTVVDWQTTVRIFFQDPDIRKNIFCFAASPAINDMLSAYRPTSGTGSLNSVEIRSRSEDICGRAEASAIGRKWRRRGRSQEDDHSLTFDRNEFGVREADSAEIGLAVIEKHSNRRTHRHTARHPDRHLSFMQYYANARERPLLSVHMSVTRRSTRRRSRIVAKRSGPVKIASPRRTVASDSASTVSDGLRRDFGGLK